MQVSVSRRRWGSGKGKTNPGGANVVVVQGNSVNWIDVSRKENDRDKVKAMSDPLLFIITSLGPMRGIGATCISSPDGPSNVLTTHCVDFCGRDMFKMELWMFLPGKTLGSGQAAL